LAVKQAQEVYAREFDVRFDKLDSRIREQIQAKIRELGTRLDQFPHQRLQGRSEYRLRVGDYRVIYDFDLAKNILYLITLGHRREVYR
jgi:mRNA interferase RelE/StbE